MPQAKTPLPDVGKHSDVGPPGLLSGDSLTPHSTAPHLGGPLELVHGRVVGRLAGSPFGSTNEIGEGLGHVFDGIDQHHLEESTEPRGGTELLTPTDTQCRLGWDGSTRERVVPPAEAAQDTLGGSEAGTWT